MPSQVIQAMREAAQCFVDLPELQKQVGNRIAALTKNEAAYVSSGAAAGLVLATAVCVTDCNLDFVHCFPHLENMKNEVVVHQLHRNGYDYAVQQVGVKLVEFGDVNGATGEDLHEAITAKTAAIFWFQGAMNKPDELPLEDVIDIANKFNIPVVVDAAAQLPPVDNLWRFTKMGASLALFSGGKDLRGPQASGLILGKRKFINAIQQHGNPNQAIGRPMKVGKEELMGLLAAVERYLTLDHNAREVYCEQTVSDWCAALNSLEGLRAQRDFPNEAGQPLPRCLVTLNPDQLGISRNDLVQKMLNGNPAVSVAPHNDHQLFLNPMTLEQNEEHIVLNSLVAAISNSSLAKNEG